MFKDFNKTKNFGIDEKNREKNHITIKDSTIKLRSIIVSFFSTVKATQFYFYFSYEDVTFIFTFKIIKCQLDYSQF